MTDQSETREIESMSDRLAAEFPGIPENSVHEVVTAAWAEVTHNPVRDVVVDLAEHAALESLHHYPIPPSASGSPDG